jgi:hypothetical protein
MEQIDEIKRQNNIRLRELQKKAAEFMKNNDQNGMLKYLQEMGMTEENFNIFKQMIDELNALKNNPSEDNLAQSLTKMEQLKSQFKWQSF